MKYHGGGGGGGKDRRVNFQFAPKLAYMYTKATEFNLHHQVRS